MTNKVSNMNNLYEELIFADAVSSLLEYYTCLNDTTLVSEFRSIIQIPNSGNNQADYENTRNQLEKLAKKYEFQYLD